MSQVIKATSRFSVKNPLIVKSEVNGAELLTNSDKNFFIS